MGFFYIQKMKRLKEEYMLQNVLEVIVTVIFLVSLFMQLRSYKYITRGDSIKARLLLYRVLKLRMVNILLTYFYWIKINQWNVAIT